MAFDLGLSYGTLQHTVENVLQYCTICSRWVAHVLTDDNKAGRMMVSLSFLQHYAREENNYVHQVMW